MNHLLKYSSPSPVLQRSHSVILGRNLRILIKEGEKKASPGEAFFIQFETA